MVNADRNPLESKEIANLLSPPFTQDLCQHVAVVGAAAPHCLAPALRAAGLGRPSTLTTPSQRHADFTLTSLTAAVKSP